MFLVGRKASLILFVICSGFASVCVAVGFGNLKVNSYLSEPLAAEIHLTGIKDLDPFALQARLASPTDFERAGIARSPDLYNLVFEIATEKDNPSIIIKTTETIKSPYLEFLVELVWPDGRLVKNYVILLDTAPVRKKDTVAKKKPLKKEVAAKPKVVTSKPKIEAKPKKSVASSKLDTPLLPNVVPDIDDVNVDATSEELHKTSVISNTKSVIKTEAVKKSTVATIEQIDLELQAIIEPVIESEAAVEPEPVAEPVQPAPVAARTLKPSKPLPLEIVPPTNKKILEETQPNYLYLVLLFLVLLATAGFAIVIRRKYAAGRAPVLQASVNDTTSIAKFSHIVGYSPVLQMKIDLAKQYIEIDDRASARELLSEVIAVAADGKQKSEAQLLDKSIS